MSIPLSCQSLKTRMMVSNTISGNCGGGSRRCCVSLCHSEGGAGQALPLARLSDNVCKALGGCIVKVFFVICGCRHLFTSRRKCLLGKCLTILQFCSSRWDRVLIRLGILMSCRGVWIVAVATILRLTPVGLRALCGQWRRGLRSGVAPNQYTLSPRGPYQEHPATQRPKAPLSDTRTQGKQSQIDMFCLPGAFGTVASWQHCVDDITASTGLSVPFVSEL